MIETRSLIDVFDRLQTIAVRTPTFNPEERQGWREITNSEKETLKNFLALYSEAKKKSSKMIIEIRNEVCAHRGNLNWKQIMDFWDKITPSLIEPILNTIAEAFNYIQELDLFEWNRSTENGTIEIIGPFLRPEYFKN